MVIWGFITGSIHDVTGSSSGSGSCGYKRAPTRALLQGAPRDRAGSSEPGPAGCHPGAGGALRSPRTGTEGGGRPGIGMREAAPLAVRSTRAHGRLSAHALSARRAALGTGRLCWTRETGNGGCGTPAEHALSVSGDKHTRVQKWLQSASSPSNLGNLLWWHWLGRKGKLS